MSNLAVILQASCAPVLVSWLVGQGIRMRSICAGVDNGKIRSAASAEEDGKT